MLGVEQISGQLNRIHLDTTPFSAFGGFVDKIACCLLPLFMCERLLPSSFRERERERAGDRRYIRFE